MRALRRSVHSSTACAASKRALAFRRGPASTSAAPTAQMQQHIPGLQRWIEYCNNGAAVAGDFLPLNVSSTTVGYLSPSFADRLLNAEFKDVFQKCPVSGGVAVHTSLVSQQQRTAAIAAVLQQLNAEGGIQGWRGELYPAASSLHAQPAFLIERAAAPYFGIKAYGVHVNGYVCLPDGSKELWVARRSRSKPTWPGKLDHIVAGGLPHGLSCAENVSKECAEEAGMPAELAAQAVPVGAVSYTSLQAAGLKRDVLLCYDLQLPANFVPQPQDGEVEEFFRLPVPQVVELMATSSDFKENCCLVIIDWLVRHSYLTPDMPGYLELVAGLRSGDCS